MKRIVGALLALLLLAAVGVWGWARPRAEIAVPGPDATPKEVVVAYVEAVNARDFDTANAIHPGDPFGRFERSPRMANLDVGPPRNEKTRGTGNGQTKADDFEQAWFVPVTFDLTGADASMPDGPTVWGYLVVRDSDRQPWQIVDEGPV